MFTKMKNIDSAFRYVRMFSIAFIAACTIISLFIAYKSYQLASQSQQKIFILAAENPIAIGVDLLKPII